MGAIICEWGDSQYMLIWLLNWLCELCHWITSSCFRVDLWSGVPLSGFVYILSIERMMELVRNKLSNLWNSWKSGIVQAYGMLSNDDEEGILVIHTHWVRIRVESLIDQCWTLTSLRAQCGATVDLLYKRGQFFCSGRNGCSGSHFLSSWSNPERTWDEAKNPTSLCLVIVEICYPPLANLFVINYWHEYSVDVDPVAMELYFCVCIIVSVLLKLGGLMNRCESNTCRMVVHSISSCLPRIPKVTQRITPHTFLVPHDA